MIPLLPEVMVLLFYAKYGNIKVSEAIIVVVEAYQTRGCNEVPEEVELHVPLPYLGICSPSSDSRIGSKSRGVSARNGAKWTDLRG